MQVEITITLDLDEDLLFDSDELRISIEEGFPERFGYPIDSLEIYTKK